jgi:hypothetical protein
MADSEIEVVAQELSALGQKLGAVEKRLADVEKVNARLEEAALSTAAPWRSFQRTGTRSPRRCAAAKSQLEGDLGGERKMLALGRAPR